MPISDKQASFIRSLLQDRQPNELLEREALEVLHDGDRKVASGVIERLLNAPRRVVHHDDAEPAPDLKPGRYALPSDFDPQGTPVFYKVDRPDSGKWAGFTFLRRIIGPNEVSIKARLERNLILKRIAEDEAGALRRYGHLSGHCGNCGLELTDKFSRFIGVGPVCREKLGLPKSEASFVRDGGVLPDEYVREVEHEAAQAREDARQRAAEARDEDYVFGDADGVLDHEAAIN